MVNSKISKETNIGVLIISVIILIISLYKHNYNFLWGIAIIAIMYALSFVVLFILKYRGTFQVIVSTDCFRVGDILQSGKGKCKIISIKKKYKSVVLTVKPIKYATNSNK